MTEQELRKYYTMFTDAWKFFRKWAVSDFPIAEKQWEQIVEEGEEFLNRYDRGKMAEYLMLAAQQRLDELERQARK